MRILCFSFFFFCKIEFSLIKITLKSLYLLLVSNFLLNKLNGAFNGS